MKNSLLTGVFVIALNWNSPVVSATESELTAISTMGELNGVALQCRYVDQMQRIKRVLILNLPKQRQLGEWFEQATNRSFLNFMESDSLCPPPSQFVEQVDAAVKVLEQAFKK